MRGNAIWNVFGVAIPTLVGLLAIPHLISNIGIARFGILSLCWVLIGFVGVLDIGIGRGLTQALARKSSRHAMERQSAGLAIYGILGVGLLGVLWGGLVVINAQALVKYVFAADGVNLPEVTDGIIWLGASIPVAMAAVTCIAVLESYQLFAVVNPIRIVMGVATYLVPLFMSYMGCGLGGIIGSLLGVRAVALLAYLAAAVALVPAFTRPERPRYSEIKSIFHFGGWLTVSNIISSSMMYLDKLAISRYLGAAELGHYNLPADALYRLTALPLALTNALFPAIAKEFAFGKRTVAAMVGDAVDILLACWLPLLLLVALLAEPLLQWWVGKDIAAQSVVVMQWFSVGVFVNGCALLPYTLLQAEGRSDLTAIFHVAEFPVFLIAIGLGVSYFGIAGVAAAWTVRVSMDALLLYLFSWKEHSKEIPEIRRAVMLLVGGALVIASTFWLKSTVTREVSAVIVTVLAFIRFGWLVFQGFKKKGFERHGNS